MSDTPTSASGPACLFCSGTIYGPGPGGRLSMTRKLPRCQACGSLERHRVLRRIYNAIPDARLGQARCLQFSPDFAAPRERFKSFEISVFGGDNSLDITAVDRPQASYEWVIANHVIEHVGDDAAALRDMARILVPDGVLQITVPTPATALETREFGRAVPERMGHWRSYGSDWPLRRTPDAGLHALQAMAHDPATESWDYVYFLANDRRHLIALGKELIEGRVPVVWWG